MLVLSRKAGQRIQIGSNVTLMIVSMKGGQVRIGIDAPEDIRVLRSELARDEWSDVSCQSDVEPAMAQ